MTPLEHTTIVVKYIHIRDTGSIPGLGQSPEGRHDNPLQYSCLENLMDRGALWAMVHRVAEADTAEET